MLWSVLLFYLHCLFYYACYVLLCFVILQLPVFVYYYYVVVTGVLCFINPLNLRCKLIKYHTYIHTFFYLYKTCEHEDTRTYGVAIFFALIIAPYTASMIPLPVPAMWIVISFDLVFIKLWSTLRFKNNTRLSIRQKWEIISTTWVI